MIAMVPHKSRVLRNQKIQKVEKPNYFAQWWQRVLGENPPTWVIVLQSIIAYSLIFGLAALFMFV